MTKCLGLDDFRFPPCVCIQHIGMTHPAFILITYSGCNVMFPQTTTTKNTIYLVMIYLFLNFGSFPLIKDSFINGKIYNKGIFMTLFKGPKSFGYSIWKFSVIV